MSKLAEAKQILIDRGRTTGILEDEQGCVCPLGALNIAYHGTSGRSYYEDEDGSLRIVEEDFSYAFMDEDGPEGLRDDVIALASVAKEGRHEDQYLDNNVYPWVYQYNDSRGSVLADEEVLSLFDKAMELV